MLKRRKPMKRGKPLRQVGKKRPKPTALPSEHEPRLRRFWIIAAMGFPRMTMASLKELAAIRGRKIDSRNKFNRIRADLISGIKGRDCIVCGSPAEHRHHIVPLGQGGVNAKENCCPLCTACHTALHPHMENERCLKPI